MSTLIANHLKAVNPNAKTEEDTRAPAELIELIKSKGREVQEILGKLAARQGLIR